MEEEKKQFTNKSDAALREEKVLEFWRENKIFDKSLAQTEGKKEFIFYEGPPTANGKPGIHHLEARAFKDAIPRYKTMQGFHVRRKGGWDTHGLAVEIQTEKKLKLDSKKAIEEYGIAKFNRECKESVWEYLDVWNKFTKRIGYWVDQDNPYVTYHNDYIESVWNILKKVHDQNLLYKDYKVVPWCPRCGTALSSHELAQGYEDVKDLSVYVKFRVRFADEKSPSASSGRENTSTYFLAWTTTPWTLPGNVALAVGKDIDYVEIKVKDEILVLAEEKLSTVTDAYEIIARHKGRDMVGMQYESLFPYLTNTLPDAEKSKLEKAFKIYPADFVNTAEGTGIVHTAVMYGQDDFELGTKVGLPKHHLVDLEGKFIRGTGFLEGRFVREVDQNGKPTLAVDIIEDLKKRNLFFKQENYKHSYPHCWRCHTALIYYARDSWYIKMSHPKIKKELINENKKINWEPRNIRDGRFGQWLGEIKDWAISRERYWGTPLPIWISKDGEMLLVDSSETLKKYSKKSGNKYFVIRHGGTEGNRDGIVSYKNQESDHLTEYGKAEVSKSAAKLKKEKIDYIITSNFARAKESAEILRENLGLSQDKLIEEPLLREMNPGEYDGKSWDDYHAHIWSTGPGWFQRKIAGCESLEEVKRRTAKVLYGLEEKYKNKNIVLVTHGAPAWLLFVNSGLYEPDNKQYHPQNSHVFVKEFRKFENAEARELPFVPLPHDENLDIDFHRPYIDEFRLIKDGKEFERAKEVMDVWLDSGAMPFAQDHYPFDVKDILYPADFISEAIDQTRGWFYTLHAVGILMGRGRSYKNVICLGHLLDAKGKKMSKSLGNVVDPWMMIEKYGVDTLRLWMYSINQPGESKNFDEKTVSLLKAQVFGLLYNVLAFYELYRDRDLEKIHLTPSPLSDFRRGAGERSNILDQWILARLDELIKLSTKNLDNYKLLEPVRLIRDFINDLSTWYLRRSRERLKDGDRQAKQTLYFVLKTLSKVMAPFAPFTAEDIWLKLKTEDDLESVHLTKWPKIQKSFFGIFGSNKEKILGNMQTVRNIVTLGLEARQKAKIQVRQPLASLKCKVESRKLSSEYIDLVKEELNVREVILESITSKLESSVELDTNITPALKAEGEYRAFMRELQNTRKKMGLNPSDKMPMTVGMIYKKYKIMPNLQLHMLRVAAVASLICDNFDEPVSKEEIVTACLLHDMGNIIKSKLEYFPEFLEGESLEYWQKVKNEFIEKYGKDEHKATIKILNEIGLSPQIVKLVDQIRFSLFCNHAGGDDINMKIISFADSRVNPHGIVSYEERMNEVKKRHQGREDLLPLEEREDLVKCGRQIEKQIFSKCRLKPEDINDKNAAPIISSLKNFVIHSIKTQDHGE